MFDVAPDKRTTEWVVLVVERRFRWPQQFEDMVVIFDDENLFRHLAG